MRSKRPVRAFVLQIARAVSGSAEECVVPVGSRGTVGHHASPVNEGVFEAEEKHGRDELKLEFS
jgi:hypothetical protein